MRTTTLVLVGMSLLAGCDNARLSGEVNGEGVGGARDAFYDTLEISLPFIGNYKVLVLMVTDFPEGCAVFDDLLAAVDLGDCSSTCDAVVAKAEEHHLDRDDYWSTTFQVNASDSVNADFTYDTDLKAGNFTASFSSWNATPFHDTTSCKTTCDDGNLFGSSDTAGKDGTLTLAEDGDAISGKFDLTLEGDGAVNGAFAAQPCDMGGWSIFD